MIRILLYVATILLACNHSKKMASNSITINDSDVKAGLQLIAKNDCFTCHKTNALLIGPSYMKVAEKYKGNSKFISPLADRVIKGSQGHWGKVPMTPHPSLSLEDARLMVKYVLSLNQ